jgi:DNA-directed RNA polymerase specialized sigma24 family protein
MAKPKGSGSGDETETVQPIVAQGTERVANVLALLLVKDMKQVDAIPLLNRAGFPVREIAALLGTSRNNVSVSMSKAKKTGKKAKGKSGKD